jgi:ATP-binding cassette subfamily B protein
VQEGLPVARALTVKRLSDLNRLVRYLRPRRGEMAVLGLLLLASTVLAVLGPQFLRRFIDETGRQAPVPALLRIAVVYLAVTLLAELLSVVADYLGARLAWSATNEMRVDLTRHCLGLDMSFYEEHSGGELIERVDGDVGQLANFFSQMFLLIVSNLLLLVGIGVALLAQDWRIGLCYVPLVVGSVLLLRKLVGVAIPAAVEQRAATARVLGFLEERLGGLEDLRANGAGDQLRRGFWRQAARLLAAARRAAQLGVRWPAAAQGLASVGLVLALLAGAALYLTHQLSLGGAYLFVAYAGMLQAPLMTIVLQVRDLEDALGALRRINQLLDTRSSVVDGPDRLPERAAGSGLEVRLDGVSFHYRPDEFALRDVSVSVPAGRRLAIVGRTGAGKSTLAKLLFRFADPSAGRVLVAGRDLRELTVGSVRDQIGMVTQEVQIFHDTVRDNVTVFDTAVGDEAVTAALREVGLGDWLDGLPDGLDTMLGAGAVGLSAGEAQLLAFARVLVADPGLLVLDEASSRLDPRSRRRFERALDRLLAGRTAVIIAHRLDAVRTADQVLVLRDGQVVEYGDRTALQADPESEFSRLWLTGEVPA